MYLQFTEPVPDYVSALVDCVCKMHREEPDGDVLAFLTGSEEVDRAISLLKEHLSENSNKHCKFKLLDHI